MPLLRIRRRFEFVGAEDAKFLSGASDFQLQRDLESRPLEVGDADAVDASGQVYVASLFQRRMHAVVVDDELVIDVKLGPVVGKQRECVNIGGFDPESPRVVDGEPFGALGDAWKALFEILRRYVERCGVDGAGGFQFFEIRQTFGAMTDVIDQTAEPGWNYDRSSENGRGFLLGREKTAHQRQQGRGRAHDANCIMESMRQFSGFLLKLYSFVSIAVCSIAADAFYLGTWKITSAVVAPWVSGPAYDDDTKEMKSLVGKTIVIKPSETVGPGILACKGPKYRVVDFPANMLFQGAFEEMQSKDKSVDPAKIAAKLGFRGTKWKTLETGCANELDYHFVDAGTAEFALNNYIYTLKKQ